MNLPTVGKTFYLKNLKNKRKEINQKISILEKDTKMSAKSSPISSIQSDPERRKKRNRDEETIDLIAAHKEELIRGHSIRIQDNLASLYNQETKEKERKTSYVAALTSEWTRLAIQKKKMEDLLFAYLGQNPDYQGLASGQLAIHGYSIDVQNRRIGEKESFEVPPPAKKRKTEEILPLKEKEKEKKEEKKPKKKSERQRLKAAKKQLEKRIEKESKPEKQLELTRKLAEIDKSLIEKEKEKDSEEKEEEEIEMKRKPILFNDDSLLSALNQLNASIE